MNGMLKKRKKKKPASPSPKPKTKTQVKAPAKPKGLTKKEFQALLVKLCAQARAEAVRLQPSSNAALCQNYSGQAKAFDQVILLAKRLKG